MANNNTSYTKILIELFKTKNAITQNNSILLNELKLPFSNKVRDYLIENLLADGFIVKDQDRYWFDNKKWETEVKKITKQYFLLLLLPIIIFAISYLIFKVL